MTPTELAALSDLSDLRAWLRDGNAYMEHPDGQDGTDTAVEALDWIVDDRRYLIARGVGDVRAFRDAIAEWDAARLEVARRTPYEVAGKDRPPLRRRLEKACAALVALLDERGGEEQTQASLEPSQHQGVNTVAQDCDVISASPATPGEPQEVPMSPEKELLSALGIVCREGSWYAPFYNADGSETIMPVREWVTARREAATRLSRAPTEAAVEKALRKLLWLSHGCAVTALYGDDGEMSCNACRIDFKRDSPETIDRLLHERGKRALAAARTEEAPDAD